MARITFLWVLGIILIVPYSVYQLLFHAQPEQYAFLIVAPLFWVFGFWGVVGPMLAAARVHRLMKSLEVMRDREQLRTMLEQDGREAVIDLVARDNRLPGFVAESAYERFLGRLQAGKAKPDQPA